MVAGQVGFHRPANKRRIEVEKNQSLVRQLEKTRTEGPSKELYGLQQEHLQVLQRQKKAAEKEQRKQAQIQAQKEAEEKELRSYDRLFTSANNTTTAVEATADSTAAEEYEDDFF